MWIRSDAEKLRSLRAWTLVCGVVALPLLAVLIWYVAVAIIDAVARDTRTLEELLTPMTAEEAAETNERKIQHRFMGVCLDFAHQRQYSNAEEWCLAVWPRYREGYYKVGEGPRRTQR